MKHKIVVIIGGSSGMGYEIALQTRAGATLRGVDIQNETCGTMKAIERSTLASSPICSSAKRNREARLRG